jgi:hypothetical protein
MQEAAHMIQPAPATRCLALLSLATLLTKGAR